MTLRTPQQLSRNGTTRTFTAVAPGGDSFVNSGKEVVSFKNTDASSVTVTFAIPGLVDEQAVPGKSCVVPATAGDVITNTFPSLYNDVDGNVNWTYSATPVGLTVAVLRVS